MLRISTLVGLTGALALAAGSPAMADHPSVSGVVDTISFPTALRVCPPGAGHDGHTLCAVVSSLDSKYGLTVRDERGALESVTLHQGTIIEPTGFEIKPGTPVYIVGSIVGGTFDADRIETPLTPTRPTAAAGESVGVQLFPRAIPNGGFQGRGPSVEGGG